MKINFFLDEIQDPYVRDNFKRLQDAITLEAVLRANLKHYEITVESAVTNYEYPHHLTFVPKDVFLTSISDGATITFHYDDFDRTNIVFTTSGACTFRAFIGTYRGGA